MAAFLSGLEAMIPIFIMLALGYVLTRCGKIDDSTAKFMSWFVLAVALPCSIFKTIVGNFTLSEILGYGKLLIYPYAVMIVTLLLGFAMAKVFKAPQVTSGPLMVLVALNNTIFMGLPVNLALYGEVSTPYVLCYYLANTTLFWTVGVFVIASSVRASAGSKLKKLLTSPPLVVIVLSSLYLFVKKTVPSFEMPSSVMSVIKTIADMSTPFAMMYIGHVLAKSRLGSFRITKLMTVGLAGRFILAPAVSVLVFALAPIDPMAKKVFITQSFMPVMATLSIVAREYGADDEYCARMVALSNLICLLILPAVSAMLKTFGL